MNSPAPPGGVRSFEETLKAALLPIIREHDADSPRSTQVAIGPSELGDVCDRRLAYKRLDWDRVNTGDPWFAIIGTAVHAWLADAFTHPRHGGRWLIEERVTIRPGLSGSCDLFDTETGTVIDWKVVGATSLSEYRSRGPSARYRTQAHLYAAGMLNAGHPVQRVAIVFLPRSASLTNAHIWSQPYTPAVVDQALARLDAITELLGLLDPEANPERWATFPARPGADCRFCPWWRPGSTELSTGCPGDITAAPDSLRSLIA